MKIKCTYEECSKHFSSERAMIAHKIKDPEHSYCERCNIDCDGDMLFFIHQLGSPLHICCPVCGEEFKSSGGRDLHLQHFHRAAQKLECAGCQAKFTSASSLMFHIENDECKVIRLTDFQLQRAEKQLEKEVFEADPQPSTSFRGLSKNNLDHLDKLSVSGADEQTKAAWETESQPLAPKVGSWERGSQPEELEGPKNNAREAAYPPVATPSSYILLKNSLSHVDDVPSSKGDRSLHTALGGPVAIESNQQFPALPSASLSTIAPHNRPTQQVKSTAPCSDLIDFNESVVDMAKLKVSQNAWGQNNARVAPVHKSRNQFIEGWLSSMNNTANPLQDDHKEVASLYERKVPTSGVNENVPPSTQALDPNPDAQYNHVTTKAPQSAVSSSTALDVERFWNVLQQEYVCPGNRCKRRFGNAQAFRDHMLSKAHVGGVVVCPSCLKRFATTSAWVAHTEAPSRRCDIKNSVNFNAVMREITGGVLGSHGFTEDGTVNYVAPKIQDW